MEAQDKRRELAAELTRELSGDPELRRDVSRELECHLEDGVEAARRRGLSEAESEAAALEDFGPASGLPQMLVEGNLNRMQSRAKLKLLLEWVLIPVALLAALMLGGRECWEMNRLQKAVKPWYAETTAEMTAVNCPEAQPRNLEEKQAQAITRLAYLPNDDYKKALAAAMQIDPGNGYLELEALLQKMKRPQDWREDEKHMKTGQESDDFLATMNELERILSSPVFTSRREVDRQRCLMYVESFGFSRTIMKIQAISSGVSYLVPAMGSKRELALALGRRAVFAHQAGREQEVDRALRLMEKLMQSLVLKDEPVMVHLLVVSAIPGELLKEPDFVAMLETSPSRQALGVRLRQICALCDEWRVQIKGNKGNFHVLLSKKASIEARMMWVSWASDELINEEILAPNRNMEYRFLDKWLVLFGLSMLFLVLCFLVAAILSQRRRAGAFLPLPRLKDLLRHLALTMALPLLIFELFKLSPWSSHAFAMHHSASQFIFEQALLWCLILPVSLVIWQRSCTRRLKALGVSPAKNPGFNWWLAVIFGSLGILGLLSFSYEEGGGLWLMQTLGIELLQKLAPTAVPVLGFMITCGVLSLISLSALLWRFFRRDGLLFRLCLARSTAVLIAFQVLSLSGYVAVLRAEETHYDQLDTTFQVDANGLSRIESELVRSWRDKLKVIWAGGDSGK